MQSCHCVRASPRMREIFAKMRKEDHKRGGGRWHEEVGRRETFLFSPSGRILCKEIEVCWKWGCFQYALLAGPVVDDS